MIKLVFEDKTLNDIEEHLLPFVHWKSLKVSDLENVKSEIVSKYIFEMARPVMKSMIKAGRVNLINISDEDWERLATDAFYDGYSLFDMFQLPYSAIMHILSNEGSSYRHAQKMAATQLNMPLELSAKHIGTHALNYVLLKNSNPALIDYIFSDEGVALLKKEGQLGNIQFITSVEAEKLGISKVKNRTISPEILRRAGACGNGVNYCAKMMKELGVSSIKWDDAIAIIRNTPKFQTRSSLVEYMNWIYNRGSSLPE